MACGAGRRRQREGCKRMRPSHSGHNRTRMYVSGGGRNHRDGAEGKIAINYGIKNFFLSRLIDWLGGITR